MKQAQDIEAQVKQEGRIFKGTLTKMPDVDWDMEVEKLSLDKELKEKIKEKLHNEYLKRMKRNIQNSSAIQVLHI